MLRFLYISACLVIVSDANQDHTEKLFIRQLPQGRTLAHFEFVTTWDTHHLMFNQAANGTTVCASSSLLSSCIRPAHAQYITTDCFRSLWQKWCAITGRRRFTFRSHRECGEAGCGGSRPSPHPWGRNYGRGFFQAPSKPKSQSLQYFHENTPQSILSWSVHVWYNHSALNASGKVWLMPCQVCFVHHSTSLNPRQPISHFIPSNPGEPLLVGVVFVYLKPCWMMSGASWFL